MIKIAFVILALIFAFTQINGSVKKTTQVYHFFNPADYAAMDFLKNNTLNSTILALPQVSTALTPITGNKVCTITRAQLSGGLNPENVRDAITNGDCKKINDLMVECKTKYVVSKSELNCDFLNRIESLNLYQHKNDLLK